MGQKRKVSKTEAMTHQPESEPADKCLPSQEAEQQPETQANSEKARKLKANATPRRSTRISAASPPVEDEIERVIAEVTLIDSEKEEDDEQPVDDEANLPESSVEKLQEKIDRLIALVEDQRGQTKSKNARNENPGVGSEISYKNLYIDSQKKIGILTDENYKLNLKLERTLGKLEAYETTHPFSTALEKLRELIVATNFVKPIEPTVNVTPQAIRDALGASHETGKKKPRK